jgi:hypothetical protein
VLGLWQLQQRHLAAGAYPQTPRGGHELTEVAKKQVVMVVVANKNHRNPAKRQSTSP